MESGGKLLLVLLAICLQILTCCCSSLDFQHRNFSSWEILIGANENEFQYDFCHYDHASEDIERCKNNPRATVDMRKACNCSVNHTANANKGSTYFKVICNNDTLDGFGACPQKLTISYEQGNLSHPVTSAETAADTQMEDKSNGCVIWIVLLSLSFVINVVFVVLLFMGAGPCVIWVQGAVEKAQFFRAN